MDRIQNFCSDITIDIAFEADNNSNVTKVSVQETPNMNESGRLGKLGIDSKVDDVKKSIKDAKNSMADHDFVTAKRNLIQVKRNIADVRSMVNSIEPDSKESKTISKICNGISNAIIVITGAYIGGVIGGIPKSKREYAKTIQEKTRAVQSAKAESARAEDDLFGRQHDFGNLNSFRKAGDASQTLMDAKYDLNTTYPQQYISKLGMAAGAGISSAPAIALYKFMDKHIERKAHFIKALNLCEASVNELISNCDAAQKKVSE